MLFVGETVRIVTSVVDLDGDGYLEVSPAITAIVEFFTMSGDPLPFVDEDNQEVPQPITMVPDDQVEPHIWFYDWTSLGVEPGTYQAKVTITGPGFTTFNFRKIRLRRPPFDDNRC